VVAALDQRHYRSFHRPLSLLGILLLFGRHWVLASGELHNGKGEEIVVVFAVVVVCAYVCVYAGVYRENSESGSNRTPSPLNREHLCKRVAVQKMKSTYIRVSLSTEAVSVNCRSAKRKEKQTCTCMCSYICALCTRRCLDTSFFPPLSETPPISTAAGLVGVTLTRRPVVHPHSIVARCVIHRVDPHVS
jgi:hypothetical protein